MDNPDREDVRHLRRQIYERLQSPPPDSPSVGIVGSGPAGLAAAHDLALLGIKSFVYERETLAGGMLAVGIPEYRLPRQIIQAEIDVIRSLGAEFITGIEIGKDITISQLLERHAAVIVAIGAKLSRPLRVPGGDAAGIYGGIDFLRAIALGQATGLGKKILVIGGGNVAYDAARTALRKAVPAEPAGLVRIEKDVTRLARRMGERGAEVHLACLESLTEMPADLVEITEGEEEGVLRHNGIGPAEVLKDSAGRVRAVRFLRVTSLWDENRRFSPKFDPNDVTEIECDTVLVCIGQAVNWNLFDGVPGLSKDSRGNIPADLETGKTAHEKIFIAGDAAYGPKLAIHAVASGKKIARSVAASLGVSVPQPAGRQCGHTVVENYYRETGFERLWRSPPPVHEVSERLRSVRSPVERTYSLADAQRQAHRCLSCNVNTVFDSSLCILCGGCVDVCPEDCLKIVPLSKLLPTEELNRLARETGDSAENTSAIIKDEDRCIRCALCAERCPAKAITMESFHFQEKVA
ncbi:MAG: FAD-dependent oxidoreductase [Bdellovibrionota bacterium]